MTINQVKGFIMIRGGDDDGPRDATCTYGDYRDYVGG